MRGSIWSALVLALALALGLSREKEEAVLRSMVAEKRRKECVALVEQ